MQTFQLANLRIDRHQFAFSPNGRWLAVGTRPFTVLDTTGGEPRAIPQRTARGGTFVWNFAFIGPSEIAYAPVGGDLWAFDLDTRVFRDRKFKGADPYSIAADGRGEVFFVSAHPPLGSRRDGDLRRLHAGTLRQQGTFAPSDRRMWDLTVSANGEWLASGDKKNVWVWNVGGKALPTRRSAEVKTRWRDNAFALSADGAVLAGVDRFGLYLWKTKGGKQLLFSGKHRRAVTAVACHPAKPLVATGDNGGQIFLWDHAGNIQTRLDWGLGEVYGLAFSADGLRCAAVGAGGKVVVWDVDA